MLLGRTPVCSCDRVQKNCNRQLLAFFLARETEHRRCSVAEPIQTTPKKPSIPSPLFTKEDLHKPNLWSRKRALPLAESTNPTNLRKGEGEVLCLKTRKRTSRHKARSDYSGPGESQGREKLREVCRSLCLLSIIFTFNRLCPSYSNFRPNLNPKQSQSRWISANVARLPLVTRCAFLSRGSLEICFGKLRDSSQHLAKERPRRKLKKILDYPRIKIRLIQNMDKVSWGLPSVSWRRILLLSITLNVGLLSRVIYQKGGLSTLTIPTKTQGFEGFLSEKNTRETKMTGVPERAAHGGENDISFSTRRTEAQDSGDRRSINLQHGDPKMFEGFWQKVGDEGTIVIPGWQSMSYFSDIRNICWFLEPGFAKEVIRLHNLVGNAVTEDRHIVVGTGSTQLFQAALYALSPPDASLPINVVSAVPYYSSYPLVTDYLKSGLFKWAGDAYNFDKDEPYIELVCSPNNPDGHVRQAVVDKSGGMLVHDLAYYWPQYTPITSPADYDIMLFTASKTTGHAGIRIGWALVKDKEVAKQMTKFIELNTIGVSKDSQLRAAKILQVISGSCQNLVSPKYAEDFFQHTRRLMTERWQKLRDAAGKSGLFSLPEFHPGHCNYFNEVSESHPAFAWLRCEGGIEDCENFLRSHMILTRSGKYFGADMKYVRVSMLDNEETFSLFVDRLSNIRL